MAIVKKYDWDLEKRGIIVYKMQDLIKNVFCNDPDDPENDLGNHPELLPKVIDGPWANTLTKYAGNNGKICGSCSVLSGIYRLY